MTAAPRVRRRQYQAALTRRTGGSPQTYGPFTRARVRAVGLAGARLVHALARGTGRQPARPPRPRHGYPRVPTLVLSGELDSITTPAEGALVARQFPRSRQIRVANSFHVTAEGDTDDCAVRILRRFVRTPSRWPRHGCAGGWRRCGRWGSSRGACATSRRPAAAAPLDGPSRCAGGGATVADLVDRWWSNYSGHYVGLRGGTWSYTGDRTTVFHLHGVRLTSDLAVSGTATWRRYANRMAVDLRVRVAGHGAAVSTATGQPARSARGRSLRGSFDGRPVTVGFDAP